MANLLHESFEGTGYENIWVETVGSGSVVDEDNTDVTPPTGGGGQILKIQKVSPNFNADTTYNFGSEKSVTYNTFYLRIEAESLPQPSNPYLVYVKNIGATYPWLIELLKSSFDGSIHFQFEIYNNGAYVAYVWPPVISFNLGQWYKHQVKYDDIGHTWEWKIDGVSLASGNLTGTHLTGPQYFTFGSQYNAYAWTQYVDLVDVDDTGYGFGSGTLKYWNNAAWVKAKTMARVSGSWQSRPIKCWDGTEWVGVDGLGG